MRISDGVQTCALPISAWSGGQRVLVVRHRDAGRRGQCLLCHVVVLGGGEGKSVQRIWICDTSDSRSCGSWLISVSAASARLSISGTVNRRTRGAAEVRSTIREACDMGRVESLRWEEHT